MKRSTEKKFEEKFNAEWCCEKKPALIKNMPKALAIVTCFIIALFFGVSSYDKFPGLSYSFNTFTLTFMNGDEVFERFTLDIKDSMVIPEYVPLRADSYFTGWYTDTALSIPYSEETFKPRDTIIYAAFRTYADTVVDFVRLNGTFLWNQEPLSINYNSTNQTAIAEYTAISTDGQTAFEYKFKCDIRTGNGNFTITLLNDSDSGGQYFPANTVIQSMQFNSPLNYFGFSLGGEVAPGILSATQFYMGTYWDVDFTTQPATQCCARMASAVDALLLKYFLQQNAGNTQNA